MRALWPLLLILCACCRKSGAVDAGQPGPDAAWLAGRVALSHGTPTDGGTLVIRLPLEPNGLTRVHDRFGEGTMVRATVGPLYETLAHSEGGKLVPWLAEAFTESGDHLTLTITLRSGVKFHDGTELTSEDVRATLQAILEPAHSTANFRSLLETVAKLETPDPRTVVIHFSRPYFLATWTVLGAVPVLPAHALTGDFDTLPLHRAPIGTGPFRFEKWQAGTSMSFTRFEDYWGRPAHLDRLEYRFVKDEAAAVAAWEKGDFDLMTRIPPGAWRSSETTPRLYQGYRRVYFLENTYAWLGFNQRKPLFADARVRKALALLFPAELVNKTVDLGLEPRTTCPYFPESDSCDAKVQPLPFDPAAAKALLAQAGFADTDGDGVLERAGERFSFAFLAAAQSQKMAKLLPLYLDTLKAAGIDARIETVDVSGYMARVRAHDFDAMALSWSSLDAVQDAFQNFHSSQAEAGANYVGFTDPEVDALLERIRSEFDPVARAALEREVHRRVYAQQAYLFLGRRPALDAFKNRVKGLTPALGWYDLSAAWLAD